jgi:hypothetical protein
MCAFGFDSNLGYHNIGTIRKEELKPKTLNVFSCVCAKLRAQFLKAESWRGEEGQGGSANDRLSSVSVQAPAVPYPTTVYGQPS